MRSWIMALAGLLAPLPAMAGWGSGTLISDQGHVLTANHVIENCSVIRAELSNGQSIPMWVVGVDPLTDLALLQGFVRGIVPPRIRQDLQTRETVHLRGFPQTAQGRAITSSGTVYALRGPRGESDSFTMDGRIVPGESGSGVLDNYGNLVGVAYAAFDQKWYAVSAGRITDFLLKHGVRIQDGAPVGNPSLGEIASFAKSVSVQVKCEEAASYQPTLPVSRR